MESINISRADKRHRHVLLLRPCLSHPSQFSRYRPLVDNLQPPRRHIPLEWVGTASAFGWLWQAVEEQARELGVEIRRGFNCCQTQNDYDQVESILAWVLKTLRLHTRDERSYVNIREQFECAKTHDPLWNTAQTQLVREGRIQNYFACCGGRKSSNGRGLPQKHSK